MKITQEKVRQIIREEVQRLRENDWEVPAGAGIEDYPTRHEFSSWEEDSEWLAGAAGEPDIDVSGPRPSTLRRIRPPRGWDTERVMHSPVESLAKALGVDVDEAQRVKDYWGAQWHRATVKESRYDDWDEPWGHQAAGHSEARGEELEGALLDYLRKSVWTPDEVADATPDDVISDLQLDDYELYEDLVSAYGDEDAVAALISDLSW